MAENEDSKTHLSPERHLQKDFFVADILDANPKDDTASMEHPLFALKAGDHRVRVYERNGCTVKVMPGTYGCATIHDKDLWIYAISQLVEAKNRGREISRTVRFTAYDFLATTNRQTSGRGYELMAAALGRLKGTVIETSIETAGQREKAGFGLIDSWRVVERDGDERMVAVEVDLPKWLFRSVQAGQVLTLSHDYFRLRKPLDRRIYELARKHCGKQPSWRVSVAVLHEKSGSAAALREFRRSVKTLADSGELPDYRMTYDAKGDMVTFASREAAARVAGEVREVEARKAKAAATLLAYAAAHFAGDAQGAEELSEELRRQRLSGLEREIRSMEEALARGEAVDRESLRRARNEERRVRFAPR